MGPSYRKKEIKILWGFAAGRCAFPDCKRVLLKPGTDEDEAITTGQIAHIHARNSGGPRYDPTMTDRERNSYENLVLLCGDHHDQVDGQERSFSADELRKIKRNHEEWVRNQLSDEIVNVTSVELEQVTVALLEGAGDPQPSFEVVPPREKIDQNDLGPQASFLIRTGLAQSHRVEEYIRTVNKADSTFEDRLTSAFVEEYDRLREDGLDGDALFMDMLEFATQGREEFAYKAAGLAVLSHLFEACDVFES